jgi:hypothetical protein
MLPMILHSLFDFGAHAGRCDVFATLAGMFHKGVGPREHIDDEVRKPAPASCSLQSSSRQGDRAGRCAFWLDYVGKDRHSHRRRASCHATQTICSEQNPWNYATGQARGLLDTNALV